MEDQKIEVKLLDVWGSDETIANSAWVSTSKENKDRTEEDIARVVSQMLPQGDNVDHGTPLESLWLRYWIRCPIYVERQFDKYRMTQQYQDYKVEYEFGPMGRDNITQNELSLRYRTMNNSFIGIPKDIREISKKLVWHTWSDQDNPRTNLDTLYLESMSLAKSTYDEIVKRLFEGKNNGDITYDELKRAREFYRGVLGTGFFTDMQIVLNSNALKNILIQRMSPHAQPEARRVADLMYTEAVKNKKLLNLMTSLTTKYQLQTNISEGEMRELYPNTLGYVFAKRIEE